MEKKLSIIIPCYNCGKNIVTLLKTITEQYNEQVEIILINDGSTDSTKKNIELFLQNHSLINIYLVNTKNQGAAKAREYGLKLAIGEYIFFIDSDDSITKDAITQIFKTLNYNNYDLLYFSSNIHDINNNKFIPKINFSQELIFNKKNDYFINYLLQKNQYTSAVWTYIFKKDLAFKSNAKFTNRKVHEDHLFTLSLIINANSIICIPDVIYIQQRTTGSLTTSKKTDVYAIDRYIASKEGVKYLEKNKISKETIFNYKKWSIKNCIKIWKEIYDNGKYRFRLGYLYLYIIEYKTIKRANSTV